MSINALLYVARACLLLLMFVDPWGAGLGQQSKVAVVVENIERIGQNEARCLVKVTNISGKPVFSTGINMKPWYRTLDYYLEQKLGKEDWQLVAPCKDTEPPSVIQLKPAVPMVQELTLKVPLSRICKKRDIKLEGQFRIRVDYLESRVQARRYRGMFFEDRKDKPRPAPAFSEPFEIPPFRDPPGAKPNR
jgi:hypothetical protein